MNIHRAVRLGATSLLLSLLLQSPSFAAWNDNAKILVHLQTPVSKNACSQPGAAPSCSGMVTAGQLYPSTYFAYVLVADGHAGVGVSAAQFGISYDDAYQSGVDIYSWTLCADAEYDMAGWPSSGTGTQIVWLQNHCQVTEPGGSGTGVVAVLGYFYTAAYSPDFLRVTPRPNDGLAKVSDCGGSESTIGGGTLGALGYASFSASGTPGYNPCGHNTALPTCSISGPGQIQTGQTVTYHVSGSGATFVWSVTGNATINGSANGPAVQVTGGDPGGFSLQVLVTAGGRTGSCQTTVGVVPPPECVITGPSPVVANEQYTYTASITDPAAALVWSISGGGTIVSQSGLSAIVAVNGLESSFTLTLEGTDSDGLTISCSKTVSINPAPYHEIVGPMRLVSGAIAMYQAYGFSPPNLVWRISGNGTILQISGATVKVQAGAQGFFDLRVGTGYDEHMLVVTIENYIPTPALNADAKILIHLVEPSSSDLCGDPQTPPTCGSVVSAGTLAHRYFAYVVVADCFTDGTLNSGLGGVQFGIDYNGAFHQGVDILSWHSCGDLEFPTNGWPTTGSGNLVSWDAGSHCQLAEPGGTGTGVVALAGYFYLEAHTPDHLRITPHPTAGRAAVADCRAVETVLEFSGQPRNPSPLGYAAFSAGGTEAGLAPCGAQPTPVEKTTWGAIKALYGR